MLATFVTAQVPSEPDTAAVTARAESLGPRLAAIESQLSEIKRDVPPFVARTLLRMNHDLQALQKIADMTPTDKKGGNDQLKSGIFADLASKCEFKVQEELKNKKWELESNIPEERAPVEIKTASRFHALLNEIRTNSTANFDKSKAQLDEQERELAKLVVSMKSRRSPTVCIENALKNDVEFQGNQIRELARDIEHLPEQIQSMKTFRERLAALKPKSREKEQKKKDFMKIYDIPDLSGPLSALEGDFVNIMQILNSDMNSVMERTTSIKESCDDFEQRLDNIIDRSNSFAGRLEVIEDRSLSMLDEACAISMENKMSGSAIVKPMDEIMRETKQCLKDIRKELRSMKDQMAKKDEQMEV